MLRAVSVYRHAVATAPAGPWCMMSLRSTTTAAFPEILKGRLPHSWSFEACSAFTRVTACLLAESPEATHRIEGDDFVTSIAAPIATRLERQLPGGNLTR